jgi:tetratricopeptide (TPR) repeat protein
MRIALLFVLACSSPSKPEPATPTEAPTEPQAVFEKTPPSSTPQPPADPLSNEDLEAPAKPASGNQAKIAWQANSDGIALAKAQNYADASSKFRDAVARVPDPAYFYNLCYALYQQGRFNEALAACDAVDKNEPSMNVKLKAERLIARVRADAKAQQVELTK